MIPLPWLGAIPWRLIGAVGLVAVVALMGWRVSAWHEAYKALPEVEAALAAEVACTPASQCGVRQAALQAAAEAKSKEVVTGYENELAALRARPARVVRLQAAGGPLCGPGTTSPTHGTGTAAAVVPGPAGSHPDIGPALYDLARDADEVAARLRALQEWNQALAK